MEKLVTSLNAGREKSVPRDGWVMCVARVYWGTLDRYTMAWDSPYLVVFVYRWQGLAASFWDVSVGCVRMRGDSSWSVILG